MIYHFIGHTGINAYPESIVHNIIRHFKTARYSVSVRASYLIEAGVLDEISGEKKSCLDIVTFDEFCDLVSCFAALGLNGNKETEPGRTAVFGRLGKNELICGRAVFKSLAEPVPVMTSALDKRRELFELFYAYRSLKVGDLEIISEVAVNILVVVSLREFAILTVKAVSAEIVTSRRADAVSSPVAVGKDKA